MMPSRETQAGSPGPPRGIVFLIGYVTVVAGVWGYDMVACRGIVAGAVSALQRLAFLVFVSPRVLVTVLVLFACGTAAGFALGALAPFRQRKELLLFVLPVAAFLVGYGVAMSGGIPVGCSLSPWR